MYFALRGRCDRRFFLGGERGFIKNWLNFSTRILSLNGNGISEWNGNAPTGLNGDRTLERST